MRTTLRIKKLDDRAVVPGAHSALAAGLDLAACLPVGEVVVLGPGERAVVPTGVAVAIEAGFEGQIRPRSGLATKHGVTVVNAPGTIDADYRGEIKVGLINLGREAYTVEHGARIAQLIIAPVARAEVTLVDALDATSRGESGFGSTG